MTLSLQQNQSWGKTTTKAEQLRLKVLAALSNLTIQKRKAVTSLSKDQKITILPADKGRYTVVLNSVDYHARVNTLLRDTNTYESLRWEPTSGYKKKRPENVYNSYRKKNSSPVNKTTTCIQENPSHAQPWFDLHVYMYPHHGSSRNHKNYKTTPWTEPTSAQTRFVNCWTTIWKPPISSTTEYSTERSMTVPGAHQDPLILANIYMKETESRALNSFKGTAPSHWYRYVDDTWVKIKTQEVQAFTEHINYVESKIAFTWVDVINSSFAFLRCVVQIKEDRSQQIGVNRKPTHRPIFTLWFAPLSEAWVRCNQNPATLRQQHTNKCPSQRELDPGKTPTIQVMSKRK